MAQRGRPRLHSNGGVTVSIDGFSECLMSLAEDCVTRDEEALVKSVRRAAHTTSDELRNGALTPAMTGEYAAGWRSKTELGIGHIKSTIYNAKKPGLTHLLEKGHEIFVQGEPTGHRTRAYPHIEPAYYKGAEKLKEGL